MNLRPLVVVALTVIALINVAKIGMVCFAASWMLVQFSESSASILDLVGYRVILIPLITLAACFVVLWKRNELARRIVGPIDTERTRIDRQMLISSALAVVGVALVLGSMLELGFVLFIALSFEFMMPMITGVFGSSVQTGVGAILVIFHPILAAFLAPSVED